MSEQARRDVERVVSGGIGKRGRFAPQLQVRLAKTVSVPGASPGDPETYPQTGPVFPIQFIDGDFDPLDEDLCAAYTERSETKPQSYAYSIGERYIAKGTVIEAFRMPPLSGTDGGEWYTQTKLNTGCAELYLEHVYDYDLFGTPSNSQASPKFIDLNGNSYKLNKFDRILDNGWAIGIKATENAHYHLSIDYDIRSFGKEGNPPAFGNFEGHHTAATFYRKRSGSTRSLSLGQLYAQLWLHPQITAINFTTQQITTGVTLFSWHVWHRSTSALIEVKKDDEYWIEASRSSSVVKSSVGAKVTLSEIDLPTNLGTFPRTGDRFDSSYQSHESFWV